MDCIEFTLWYVPQYTWDIQRNNWVTPWVGPMNMINMSYHCRCLFKMVVPILQLFIPDSILIKCFNLVTFLSFTYKITVVICSLLDPSINRIKYQSLAYVLHKSPYGDIADICLPNTIPVYVKHIENH